MGGIAAPGRPRFPRMIVAAADLDGMLGETTRPGRPEASHAAGPIGLAGILRQVPVNASGHCNGGP
jgi:hypothetical protein